MLTPGSTPCTGLRRGDQQLWLASQLRDSTDVGYLEELIMRLLSGWTGSASFSFQDRVNITWPQSNA